MPILTPEHEAITTRIIGCAIEVHSALGPGLLESVYRDCLLLELGVQGLSAVAGRRVPIV